jgi:hypothetical protein
MNRYADLGQPVSVWATEQPSKSIADVSFAPTSITGIELTNDYEPVQYQANRALMAANAATEINDLQERNHATTAYSTLDCHATPLFPTFNAQRAVDCAIRGARQNNIPLRNLVTQPVPPLGQQPYQNMGVPGFYAPNPLVGVVKKKPLVNGGKSHSFASRMANSVKGTFYDLKHWNELPPKLAGTPPGSVLSFVVTRENRLGYLLLWVTLIVMLITLIGVAVQVGTR